MKLKKLESQTLGSACIKSSCWMRPLVAITLAVSLASLPVWADEFPANCSKPNGGQGNTSTTGVNFANNVAHVGDTVQLFPSLGMAAGACQAENATGSVYIASGLLVTFLNNVTLPQNLVYQCPTNTSPPCAPGPYNVTITPALVGAGVSSPGGSVAGVPKVVRALEWSFSSHVRAGDQLETLDKLDTASLNIVTPCIQVQKFCNLPAGKTCFGPNDNISFRGFVTNCGDITLTNVTVVDSRTGVMALFNPVTGQPLGTTITLPVGAFATFTNNYAPSQVEICAGNATNTVTARGTDTSDIGGPRASVTNSSTAICPICINPCLAVTKTCPGPILVGQPQTISGVVSNCGDITITNIIVNDNVLGPVTNIATLPPGGSVSYSKTFTAGCVGNTNTVTARGTTTCGQNITNSATAACLVTENPCIGVTKNCNPPVVQVGGIETFSGVVTNCGNIALTNVTLFDTFLNKVIATIPLLPVGGSQAYTTNYVTTAADCTLGTLTNTIIATGQDACLTRTVTASNSCTFIVQCQPAIKVYKQVVCEAPGGCEPFDNNLTNQKAAVGVRVDPNNCPAFCYRIIVTNVGNVTLSNVTVVDDSIPNPDLNLSTCFPAPFVLAPAGQANSSSSCIVTNVAHCLNTVNIVTASGVGSSATGPQTVTSQDTNNVAVVPININCTLTVSTNGGSSFFTPSVCATQSLGSSYIVRIVVTNSGQYALQNVTVSNTAGFGSCFASPRNLGALAVGATATIDCTNVCATPGRTDYAVTVTAEASQAAGHVCAYNTAGVLIRATSSCSACVVCTGAPRICVTKEVVCELPAGCSNNWSHLATGAKTADNSQCPSFCYRVRVTNCGLEALNNVTVVDNVLNLAACNFPTSLAVNQTVECILAGVEHCQNVTNTVTAAGVGASSGIHVSTNDTAAVVVLPISITCSVTVNDKPTETILCDGQGHLITNAVEVCNTGSLPLSDITISAPELVALGCTNVANIRLSLLPGQCTNVLLCIDMVTCPPDCGLAFSNHIRITATVDQTLTNVCSWTRNQSNQVVAVTATTECSAVVECLAPPKRGCTPGFWKNCTIHWQPTGYRTDQSVSSVFTMGNCCTGLGNTSLLGALDFGGGSDVCGGARILLRAAVAALLNASSPEVDYPLTQPEVIGLVSAALQTCNRATMIALASELDRANNLGCSDANGNGLPCHRLSDVPRTAPAKPADPLRVAPTRQ